MVAARLDLLGQRLPQLRIAEGLVGAGVELVEVGVVRTEGIQRGVELAQDFVGRPELIPLEVAEEAVPELGCDDALLASASIASPISRSET